MHAALRLTVHIHSHLTHPPYLTSHTLTEDGAPSTASRPDTKKHLRIPSKSEADTTAIPQTTQLPTSPQVHIYCYPTAFRVTCYIAK